MFDLLFCLLYKLFRRTIHYTKGVCMAVRHFAWLFFFLFAGSLISCVIFGGTHKNWLALKTLMTLLACLLMSTIIDAVSLLPRRKKWKTSSVFSRKTEA